MRTWLLVGALLTSGGAGFTLGRVTVPPPRVAGKPVRVEAAGVPEEARRLPDGDVLAAIGALRAEVRALREELHTKDSPAAPQGKAPPERPEETEPTPEQHAAQESAQRLVASAVRTGRWTSSDADAMRRLMPSLSVSQTTELLQVLLPAINSGAVKVDFRGPPF